MLYLCYLFLLWYLISYYYIYLCIYIYLGLQIIVNIKQLSLEKSCYFYFELRFSDNNLDKNPQLYLVSQIFLYFILILLKYTFLLL